jgi:hypothetical protein
LRHDILFVKKSVHINLTKDSHRALREKCYESSLTMQDIFHEFALAVQDQNPKVDYFFKNAVNRKLRQQLEEKPKRMSPIPVYDQNVDALYNLIEDELKKDA